MSRPPQITKNTIRLLEADLAVREAKRVRNERVLNMLWIAGVLGGALWLPYRTWVGRGLVEGIALCVWVIAMIVYLRLWYLDSSFFKNRSAREKTTEIFAALPSENRVIKGIILFIAPWAAFAVCMILYAVFRGVFG